MSDFRPLDHLRAIRASTLSGHEKAVLVWLTSYADENAIAFPSIDTLAEVSGFSRATVCRALERLRILGWLEVTRKSRTMANTYRLVIPKSQGETSQAATTQAASSQEANTPPETCDVAGGDGRSIRERLSKSQAETRSVHVSAQLTAQGTGESVTLPGDFTLKAPKGKKAGRRRTETPVPASYATDSEINRYCALWGIPTPTSDPEAAKFLDYARSVGRLYRDHGAAFRNWKRRAGDFAPRGGAPAKVRNGYQEQPPDGPVWNTEFGKDGTEA
jgi:Helix-turn-helix domain